MAKLFREIEILYEALSAEIGIEIIVSGNYQTSLQALYKARNASPEFDCLQIHKSPHDSSRLWIVKNPAKSNADGAALNPSPDEPLISLADIL